MGLPLFVAPVESDLPSKAAEKSNATSPSRSGIRRARPDRRATMRRHITIRDRLGDYARYSGLSSGRDGRFLPGVESGFPPDYELSSRSPAISRRARPFREALGDMTSIERWGGGRWGADQINATFGGFGLDLDADNGPGDDEQQEADMATWSHDSRPQDQSSVSNALESLSQQLNAFASQSQQYQAVQARGLRTLASFHSALSDIRAPSRNRANRLSASVLRDLESSQRRFGSRRRGQGVDGLGDRDRSPPSASSSFASTAASQGAGVSSSTSFTEPETRGEPNADAACESGGETSEDDGFDDEDPARIQRRGVQMRRVRLRVPPPNGDGPPEGPFSRRSGESRSLSSQGVEDNFDLVDRPLTPPRRQGQRSMWIGRFSTGSSGVSADELGVERRRLNRESSVASGNNASTTGTEDWTGMQRIVRSLARREDIPDEWWAEAGLSRTLPQDDPYPEVEMFL